MSMSTISVCMITKDEEKNIERCIKSVQKVADEIIVVDTGSTDKTVETAEKLGAKVIHKEWVNDFSVARNASLDEATMDWILFLDADEELTKEDGLSIKQLIQTEKRFEGFYLRLVNIIKGVDIGDAIVLRLFKNKPEYRFRGRMHEQVVNSIQEVSGENCIGSTDIRILHYGYDPEVSDPVEKQKRNIDLLHSYPEEERDGYFYYSIGNEYARINENTKALEMYDKALEHTDLKLFRPIYYPYLILNICKVLFGCGRWSEEIKTIKECLKTCVDFKDIYFMESLAYAEIGKYSLAKQSLLNYMNCKPQHYEYPSNNFETNYNIDQILEHLSKLSVDHDEKLVSVLILAPQCNDSIIETIKSVNEIASEVVMVVPKSIPYNMEKARNMGAHVIERAVFDWDKCLMAGIKNCKGKYILMMNPQEMCSLDTQKELVWALGSSKSQVWSLSIYNMRSDDSTTEVRIIKNSTKLKKITDYQQLTLSKPKELPIFLHKI